MHHLNCIAGRPLCIELEPLMCTSVIYSPVGSSDRFLCTRLCSWCLLRWDSPVGSAGRSLCTRLTFLMSAPVGFSCWQRWPVSVHQTDVPGVCSSNVVLLAALAGSLCTGLTFLMSAASGVLADHVGMRRTACSGALMAFAGLLISAFVSGQVRQERTVWVRRSEE